MGDKGVVKIKCRCALSAEASETCLKKVKRLSWDSVKQNKIIGRDRMRISKSSFPPEESKNKILRGYYGDQLSLEYC